MAYPFLKNARTEFVPNRAAKAKYHVNFPSQHSEIGRCYNASRGMEQPETCEVETCLYRAKSQGNYGKKHFCVVGWYQRLFRKCR